MNRKLLGALTGLALGGSAQAAGIAVDTQGGRATGLGTAVAAHVDDISSIFYNPAGLVRSRGIQLAAGDTLILPTASYTSHESGKETSGRGLSPPPHLYAAMKVSEDLAVGLGMVTNYGASVTWPEDFEYRWRAYKSQVVAFTFNPTVAYAVSDRIRLGAGVQLVRGSLNITRKLNFVDTEGSVTLAAAAWGVGANAGVQVEVVPGALALGLSYRSAVILGTRGAATFRDIPLELSDRLRDQGFKASVTTPDTVLIGISYRPLPQLLVAADAHFYRWSNIPELFFEFEDPSLNQRIPKNWRSTFNYHLGVEYTHGPLAFRAGAVYDPTPSPANTLTVDLPDTTRIKGSLGVGYTWNRLRFDVGYQYAHLIPQDSTYPGYEGTYAGNASVVGMTVGYEL